MSSFHGIPQKLDGTCKNQNSMEVFTKFHWILQINSYTRYLDFFFTFVPKIRNGFSEIKIEYENSISFYEF